MFNKSNRGGYLRRPTPSSKSNSDINFETGSSALSTGMQGAQTGMMLGGPVGAAIGGGVGAIAGGVMSYTQGKKLQKQQDRRNTATRKINESLEGLDNIGNVQNFSDNQMIANKGFNSNGKVNAEVRHSEIILDKGMNVKNIVPTKSEGGKTHKEGGHDTVLEDGDVVLPSKNKQEQKKYLSMIKRYKLNGDKSIKKVIDNLPTKETAETKSEELIANEGLNNNPFDFSNDIPENAELGEDSNFRTIVNPSSNVGINYGSNFLNRDKNPSLRTGIGNYDADITTNDQRAKLGAGMSNQDFGFDTDVTKTMTGNTDFSAASQAGGFNANKAMAGIGGAMQLAETLYNFKRGNEQAAKEDRNFRRSEMVDNNVSPDYYANLADIRENRNAGMQSLRGKGMSAAQQGSYASRFSRDAGKMRRDVGVNELNRRDGINRFNTQLRNQDMAYNTGKIDEYNRLDAQNEAAQRSFTGAGMSGISQMGGNLAQMGYIKSKDEKLDARDRNLLNIYKEKNYEFSKDSKGNDIIRFNKQS